MALITDKIDKVSSSDTARPVVALLAAPGYTMGATSININDASNWTTDTAIHFTMYTTTTIGSTAVKDPTSQTDWKGTLSGTVISNLVRTGGNDRDYSAGSIVELTPTARWSKDIADHILTEHKQDGTHENVTADSVTADSGTITDLTVTNLTVSGASSSGGWTALGATPNTITNNGNRSYTCVFNGTDLTDDLSPGMRLRTTRTVAAPTQCADLESSSSQYFSRASASVAGMTFTDDFVVSAWVKLESYTAGVIVSRQNGNGWELQMNSSGQLLLIGYNTSGANFRYIQTYQSLPLNKWIHVAGQLDMSAYTLSSTTCYMMIDGVDVPSFLTQGGTNPTALTQGGNLEIGSKNGGTSPFDGKIAQVAVYGAKVTQATIKASMNQGLTGSETSLVCAYSFNNSITDLSANANNLTANGSAVATNSDSPFGGQASGLISSTTDYGIVTSATFSTNTTVVVQVPEGNTIPTSGGVSAVSYSGIKAPYGMPIQSDRWEILVLIKIQIATASIASTATLTNIGGLNINIPIGSGVLGFRGWGQATHAGATLLHQILYLSTTTSTNTDPDLVARGTQISASLSETESWFTFDKQITTQSATIHYLLTSSSQTNTTQYINGASSSAVIYWRPTYL